MNKAVLKQLVAVVGKENVFWKPEDLIAYEYDGSVDKSIPGAVVLPGSAQEVAACVKIAVTFDHPISVRGAGTGLSGGAIPIEQGLTLGMARLNRILAVDVDDRVAVVEPGVINRDLSLAVAQHSLFYAPDPSSQQACTIGGNVAENAGGPHCLALGVTTNHVIGMEVALADGSLVWLGNTLRSAPGYDLRGAVIASEGMLCVVTKVAVRLLNIPEEVRTVAVSFNSISDATRAVSKVISDGVVPAAMEIIDRVVLDACEPVFHPGYSPDTEAVLIVEMDGLQEEIAAQSEDVEHACAEFNATEFRWAETATERAELWLVRKNAIGALGTIAPSYLLVDGVVPRTVMSEVVAKIKDIASEMRLTVGNVFHAGDGNLHPCVLFDERDPAQLKRALECGGRILETCVKYGGALSGEHGIGLEKKAYMPLVFTNDDLETMQDLLVGFGAYNIFNPGKAFPDKVAPAHKEVHKLTATAVRPTGPADEV